MSTVDQVAAEDEVFDYEAEAELCSARNRKSRSQPSGYKRFDRATEADRFASAAGAVAACPPSGR